MSVRGYSTTDRDLCAPCLVTIARYGVMMGGRGTVYTTGLPDILDAIGQGHPQSLTWVTANVTGERLGLYAVTTLDSTRVCPFHVITESGV